MSVKVICVAQQKGGAGKTTLVSNLAAAYLARGHRVALLDTDPQGSLGRWMDIREETHGENDNLQFATATAYGISRAVRSVSKSADIVLIDTPPKVDSDIRWIFREADLVLIPVSASQADVWATDEVLELTDRTDTAARIVLNRMRAGTRVGEDVASAVSELNAPTLDTSLAHRVIYAEALGHGQGVTEAKRSGPVADEVCALADEVASLLDF